MKFYWLIPLLGMLGCSYTLSPPESRLRGDIEGKLIFSAGALLVDPSGMEQITASNGDSTFVTTCDSSGIWKFRNIPSGTYTLNFEREGYTSAKIEGFQFVGGGTADIPLIALLYVSTSQPIVDSIRERITSYGITGYVFYVKGPSGARLLLDKDSAVLANETTEAMYVGSDYPNPEFIEPSIMNYQVRSFGSPIQPGDFFYVAVGFAVRWDELFPYDALPSGRFSAVPFAKPVQIVKFQYNGKP